jgi:tyrosine-specific transport protein
VEEEGQTIGWGKIISAIFLVAGTCIGGGMLALPVGTGISGFFPSTMMMTLCWLAMTASALLLLEANLWMKEGAHVITMASTLLGPIGKVVSWCVYLFISYASIVAYTAAGGSLVLHGTFSLIGLEISKWVACLIFILVFGGIIYLGNRIVGRVNSILFVAMIITYFALVSTAFDEVKLELLKHVHWSSSFLAIPLLLTTFSFHTMMPSLTPYLKRNARALRWAIVGGTTITFIVYLLWLWIVLGIVPVQGPASLMDALEAGEPITQFLREHVQSSWLSVIAEFFAFFALVTSFLGMALGLFDFLSDGLKIPNVGFGKVILSLLIIIPTFVFAAFFDRIFVLALDTSGGFGDAILNGMMPALMVWMGRYVYRFPSDNRTPGGKWLLIAVFVFFGSALLLETLIHTGHMCSIFDVCKVLNHEQSLVG